MIVFLFIFRQRVREGKREGEKHRCVQNIDWLLLACPQLQGDVACYPDKCPDQESNQRPFGLQDDTQSTEPHQSGQNAI